MQALTWERNANVQHPHNEMHMDRSNSTDWALACAGLAIKLKQVQLSPTNPCLPVPIF